MGVIHTLVRKVGITDLSNCQVLFTLKQELERRILLRGRVERGRDMFLRVERSKSNKEQVQWFGTWLLKVKTVPCVRLWHLISPRPSQSAFYHQLLQTTLQSFLFHPRSWDWLKWVIQCPYGIFVPHLGTTVLWLSSLCYSFIYPSVASMALPRPHYPLNWPEFLNVFVPKDSFENLMKPLDLRIMFKCLKYLGLERKSVRYIWNIITKALNL